MFSKKIIRISDYTRFHIRFKKCPFCRGYIPRKRPNGHCYLCGQKIIGIVGMKLFIVQFLMRMKTNLTHCLTN